MNRKLALIGFKHVTRDGQNVAGVPVFKRFVNFFTEMIAIQINLNTAGAVLQGRKACFTHHALKHHAASH